MLKPIFNSLGSNYSLSFVIQAVQQLFANDPKDLQKLKLLLEKKFAGQAFLFYKGRDAIEFAVRVLGLEHGDGVLTQAFTCQAIEEGIVRAGAQPIFVDLAVHELNPSVNTLNLALKKSTASAKAVLIQHTLAVPADIATIKQWCQQRHLPLIEDLAQALGGCNAEGQLLGSDADIIICSFGRDKVIDAVAGGAVIFKRPSDIQKATEAYQKISQDLPKGVLTRDMVYPKLTWLIRRTHAWGVGKLLFRFAKATGWLTSPVAAPTTTMTQMPAAYAHLALLQFQHLEAQLGHRLKIALLYASAFTGDAKNPKPLVTTEQISKSSNLRFPLWVLEPDKLTQALTRQKIFITDRWYRKPVDFGSLAKTTAYTLGSCPNAEKLTQHIINLPTHLGMTETDARRIVQSIKENVDV